MAVAISGYRWSTDPRPYWALIRRNHPHQFPEGGWWLMPQYPEIGPLPTMQFADMGVPAGADGDCYSADFRPIAAQIARDIIRDIFGADWAPNKNGGVNGWPVQVADRPDRWGDYGVVVAYCASDTHLKGPNSEFGDDTVLSLIWLWKRLHWEYIRGEWGDCLTDCEIQNTQLSESKCLKKSKP